MRKPSFLLLAILPALFASRAGADEPTRLPLPDPVPESSQWFGIYIKGSKFGWAHEQVRRSGEGESARWVYSLDLRMKVQAMGESSEMAMSERREFDVAPPHAFVAGRYEVRQGEGGQVNEIARKDGKWTATATAQGQTREVEVGDVDYTLADALTPRLWAKEKRSVGDRISVREFDVSELESDRQELEVVGEGAVAAEGVRVPYVEVRATSKKSGMAQTVRVDGSGNALSISFPGDMEARAEPEEDAKKIEHIADLFAHGVVRIDKPLGGDAETVRSLVVEARGPAAGVLESGPWQTVTKDADTGAVVLSVGREHGQESLATEEEIAESLRATADVPSKSTQVVSYATEAIAGATTTREKVDRLVRFVSDFVTDALVPRVCPVEEVLERKQGDCSEHALLFTALARAVGIPTRQVGGLMYMGDEIKAFGGHAWNEVVIDGRWVPVDPTWGQTEPDATHVTLSRRPSDEGLQAETVGGRLSFVLRSVQRAAAPEGAKEGASAVPLRPLLWVVEGTPRIYLFGTIHVGDEETIGLAPVVREARKASDVVLGELTMDPALQAKVMRLMFLPEGKTLKGILPEAAHARLSTWLEKKGFQPQMFERMKVWGVAVTIAFLAQGIEKAAASKSIDQVFQDEARAEGKEASGLETVEEQMGVFDELTEEQQVAFLVAALEQVEEDEKDGEGSVERLTALYRRGDVDALFQELNKHYDASDPVGKALMERLVDHRNVRMVDRLLERARAEPELTYFVAVGALHFPGPKGILALLAEKGHTVRRLAATDALPAAGAAAPR
jgi:uncharacterized protein YbaP (TraB family)